MSRRTRWRHPALGDVWVSSLEGLILAKLEWSEGTSELQLRDCRSLYRLNSGALDLAYLKAWSGRLGLSELLGRMRAEAADAP